MVAKKKKVAKKKAPVEPKTDVAPKEKAPEPDKAADAKLKPTKSNPDLTIRPKAIPAKKKGYTAGEKFTSTEKKKEAKKK